MTTRSLNKALSQVKRALDTKPSAQFKYVSLSFPDGAFCIWFDHSRHRGKLGGGGAAAVCPFVRSASVTLCGGRPATAMMGGDDNITQNVDRNEREGDKDEGRGRMQASGGTAWSVCSSSDHGSQLSSCVELFLRLEWNWRMNKVFSSFCSFS